jgi:SAM-dependent methyltransferase
MNELDRSKNLWDKKAKVRRPNPRVIAAFARPKIRFLADQIPSLQSLKTLEVGCGDGYISKHLMGRTHLLGVDLSASMLARNPLAQKAIASAYDLPFADDQFDIAIESNMLHHLDDPEKAIKELMRVSRRYVFLSEPNPHSPPIYLTHLLDPDERRCLSFGLAFLETLCEHAGLEIVRGENAGRVAPNRTPEFLLGFLKGLETVLPGGFFSMVLAQKP